NGRNHLGGKDRYLARYDFTGRPVQTRESHSSSASGSQRGLTTTLAYDHDGRLSQRRTTLSSVTTPLTARYSYDEAGRLSEKTLGPTPVSYTYNVRGWIGKIASAPFVSELRYENPRYGGAPLYSGMVSQWTWKHGQQPENDYVFSYDGVGRMVAAKHFVDGARTDGYTERGIRYDANGNLLAISRTAGGAVSDSLRFTLGGDVLLDVSGTSTGVFEYDPSGNLVKDGLNRLEFSYNCLNLMQTVQTTVGASKAQFTYGSDGRKLSEKARTGGFEYLGSLIYAYRGGTLSLAQAVTDEGTIQSAGVNYFIRDHLGSVRAVVDHTGKIVERNDYYPFGGRHENASLPLTSVNRYKFGGKETLEPVSLDMLDFGARFYDPRIARWNTQDPLAEKYFSLSPYNYCAGNPITLVDPTGMVMDDYRLKKNGEIELMKKTNDNYDVIYAENEKGEVDLFKSIQIDKNILPSKKSDNSEISKTPYDYYEIFDDNQAQKLTEFVWENSTVEWGVTSVDIIDHQQYQSVNYLSTSHLESQEYGAAALFKMLTTFPNRQMKYILDYKKNEHNHPNGTACYSNADLQFAMMIWRMFPNAVFNIYIPSKYRPIKSILPIKFDIPETVVFKSK
ncbi:RHS repeat-associated core domain-containing protein, partial [Alistipes ihumii]